MRVRFWGVRGTIPVPGPDTVRVGGNTACVEVQTEDQEVIILDAGTGIRMLGLDLARRSASPLSALLLFSHTHWDHIHGFPFFAPARIWQNRLTIAGAQRVGKQLRQLLAEQMNHNYLPFTLGDLDAHLAFRALQDGECSALGDHTTVLPRQLPHPGGVFGYRISCQGKTVVYASDVGHPPGSLHPNVVALAQDADLIIHDAQFTPQEKQERPDWGHSSWVEAVQVARQANVPRLALFHHDPGHTDDELDQIEREARTRFAGALVAREGMEIVF